MPIRFRCRHCRQLLSIGRRKAGMPTPCPVCCQEVLVPRTSDPSPPPTLALPAPTPADAVACAVPEPPAAPPTPAPPSAAVPAARGARRPGLALAGASVVVGLLLACGLLARRLDGQADPVTPGRAGAPVAAAVVSAPAPRTVEESEPAAPGRDASLPSAPPLGAALRESAPPVDHRRQVTPPLPPDLDSSTLPGLEVRYVVPPADQAPPDPAPQGPQLLSEDELRRELVQAPEFGIPAQDIPPLIEDYKASLEVSGNNDLEPTVLLRRRPGLALLPVRYGNACRLSNKQALTLQALSQKLHAYLDAAAPRDLFGNRLQPTLLQEALRREKRGAKPEWLRPEAIPCLQQLLMHEDQPVRLMLVELLAEIPGSAATVALAQRAVFDLSPEVRAAAVRALAGRRPEDYRPLLLYGLRYPWAPPADHAAEAVATLQDRPLVRQLVSLLREPSPTAPVQGSHGRLFVREVVRLKHVDNCLACHPPAFTDSDPVPGAVPGVVLTQGGVRFGSPGGGGGGYGGGGGTPGAPLMIRADVTYFRQDFSVQLPVFGATAPMRFDYLVRTRPLGPREAAQLRAKAPDPHRYAQRDAVLYALRVLTGKDPGDTTEAWLGLFPTALTDVEAARLSESLVRAAPARKEALLTKLRDGEAPVNTQALAGAIPRLTGVWQGKAREALAERLARLQPEALRTKLRDDDAEIRRAAVLAVAQKKERDLVPDLIARLEDDTPLLSQVTRGALKTLTERDFGPAADAAPDELAAAVDDWSAWWKKEKGD
jgi:HEAT repeat protein